jgi:hypothetical protein
MSALGYASRRYIAIHLTNCRLYCNLNLFCIFCESCVSESAPMRLGCLHVTDGCQLSVFVEVRATHYWQLHLCSWCQRKITCTGDIYLIPTAYYLGITLLDSSSEILAQESRWLVLSFTKDPLSAPFETQLQSTLVNKHIMWSPALDSRPFFDIEMVYAGQ